MEIIKVNSKISDILFSIEEIPGNRYFLVRKINGDLVGEDELFYQPGKSSFIKSLISKNIYYVCLYYRTSGEVVRRLEVLKKRDKDSFLNTIKHKLFVFYFRAFFSHLTVSEAIFCNVSNQVELVFSNGKVFKLNINKLI